LLYKKQQNEKARDLDKKLKKALRLKQPLAESDEHDRQEPIVYQQSWLLWLLLGLTWLGIGIYVVVQIG
jgi:hypothetical protein